LCWEKVATPAATGLTDFVTSEGMKPIAAGVATFSQHNAQTPARSVVPAQR
jgi:hypothetical protein